MNRPRGGQSNMRLVWLLLVPAFVTFTASVPTPTLASEAVLHDFGSSEISIRVDTDCIGPQQLRRSLEDAERNIVRLQKAGVILEAPATTAHPLLEFPLRAASHFDDPGYYYVFAFFDHAPAFNVRQDYNCGTRTHDAGDGAHSGIDYNLWPFDWNKMDDSDVEVIAGAPGTVILRFEGFPDRSCPGASSNDWNGIALRHDDGSLAYYVHFKTGSVTRKGVGQRIELGEYLGVVGSSGPSISPHLHLHLFDNSQPRNYIDPFAGPCNDTTDESWWAEQPPYVQPGINKISTHRQAVQWTACPNPDNPNLEDRFDPGEQVTFYTFGRDGSNGDHYEFEVLFPDGSRAFGWPHDFLAPNGFRGSYELHWTWSFPEDWPQGRYTYRLTHFGRVYEHPFEVGTVVPVQLQDFVAVADAEGVTLEWELVDEEPFQGFRLARRREGSSDVELLGGVLLPTRFRSYLDSTARPGATYTYTLSLVRSDGSEFQAAPQRVTIPIPPLALEGNRPNPFNPYTEMRFSLNQPEHVELVIFDTSGHRVVTLVRGPLDVGHHTVRWDGRDAQGRAMPSGVYFYRLSTPSRTLARRMALLR